MLVAVTLFLLLLGCAAEPPVAPEAGLTVEREEGGYAIREGGQPVLFYQLEPKSRDGKHERSNYIHPLHGLDGEVLTEDFPEDHRHHRGVYWTWHQVLVGYVRAGDPWLARGFSWRVQQAEPLPGGNGLRTVHHWHSPDFASGIEPILEETAEVFVHPAEDDLRLIDFDIRLVPLQGGVRLGGSEDDKGYGGFSVRVRMLDDLRFTAASGAVSPDRRAMDLGDWVDFTAVFGGAGATSGVAVLVHPQSAGYPQPWILRGAATPSMQNPVWPGAEPVEVPAGEGARLWYRLVLHRGELAIEALDALHAEYAALHF